MADSADVYVKNLLMDEINVNYNFRDASIASGDEDRFFLLGPRLSLTINAPKSIDTRGYSIKVRSDVDLQVMYSRTMSNWKIQIEPNDLEPEVPTTVNVTVEEGEPN